MQQLHQSFPFTHNYLTCSQHFLVHRTHNKSTSSHFFTTNVRPSARVSHRVRSEVEGRCIQCYSWRSARGSHRVPSGEESICIKSYCCLSARGSRGVTSVEEGRCIQSYLCMQKRGFFRNASNFATCNALESIPIPSSAENDDSHEDIEKNPTKNIQTPDNEVKKKNFWGAVSLIIGAAVGPGMLGLPSLTIKSGPFPSTIIILLSWLYAISSIILVAELCFDAMKEESIEEVSFTSLATRTLGTTFGSFVALVYTTLCFSLLVACVAGIGSIFSPFLPNTNTLLLHSLFPFFVGTLIVFFPFNTIDVANRGFCFLMLFSITGLVAIGLSVSRAKLLTSFASVSWNLSEILPIIPVAVLTLGFHVITPFICKIGGNTIEEIRKAILIGGVVPLAMVLSWNLIVLGLVGTNKGNFGDPISLLLSVNPSALSAVQGFAFSAMATSLIGYAVSLPKQILDTLELVFGKKGLDNGGVGIGIGIGKLGFYCGKGSFGNSGCVRFKSGDLSVVKEDTRFDSVKVFVTVLVLGLSVMIASYFRSTFSRALDFAGVYANCFLFGIIPPVMAYIHQSKKKIRSSFIPGGNWTLMLLFIISVGLGIWH